MGQGAEGLSLTQEPTWAKDAEDKRSAFPWSAYPWQRASNPWLSTGYSLTLCLRATRRAKTVVADPSWVGAVATSRHTLCPGSYSMV